MDPTTQADTVRRVLSLADMLKRWAEWIVELGYPFDFSNPDAIPDNDILDAIADAWARKDDGWGSFAAAQWDVYEEVYGTDAALAALGEPPRDRED